MNSKISKWVIRSFAVSILVLPFAAQAEAPKPDEFRGIFNDYTAATGVSGPWEMHGHWSVKLKRGAVKADFSAVMTMEHPDSWIAANPGGVPPSPPNIDNPTSRNPHTHHITMEGALVSTDTASCPVDSPATTVRYVLTGQPSITGNGSPAPFEAKGPSTLVVCITGGTEVEFSNMTMTFTSTSPATAHFGTQAIHGVVRFPRKADDSHDKH
jgi:hypothetical protein